MASDEYQCNNLKQQTGEDVEGSCAWSCVVYETPTLLPLSKDEVLKGKVEAELPRIKEFLAQSDNQEDKRKFNAQINILEGYFQGTVEAEDADALLSQIEKERMDNQARIVAQKNAGITPALGSASGCLPGNRPCIAGENAYVSCINQGCTPDQAENARRKAWSVVIDDTTKKANRGDQEAQKLVNEYNRLEEEQKKKAPDLNAKVTQTVPTKTPEQIAREKIVAAMGKLLNEDDPDYKINLQKLVEGKLAIGGISDVFFYIDSEQDNVLVGVYYINGKSTRFAQVSMTSIQVNHHGCKLKNQQPHTRQS